MNQNNRLVHIDLLRSIGLLLIILAHTNPPAFIFQLRNFDVPLMVLVSGISFGLSKSSGTDYISYVYRRFERLAFPVWLFLTLYFTIIYLTTGSSASVQTIALSYLFISGIGYVWIIRIFLIIAIISPALRRIEKVAKSNWVFCLCILLMVLIADIFDFVTHEYLNTFAYKTLQLIIPYALSFGAIFLLGLRWLQFSIRQMVLIFLFVLSIFGWLTLSYFVDTGAFVPTQEYKYPPTAYYLSFAVALIVAIDLLIRCMDLTKLPSNMNSAASFLSANSIWIYLWHIPFVEFLDLDFYQLFFVALFCSTAIVSLQIRLIGLINTHISPTNSVAKFILKISKG